MSNVLIVVDKLEDWEAYYPSELVISFDKYLALKTAPNQRIRVINLCSDYSYLSQGYYCSLLAEAKGHHVIPSSKVLTDVGSPLLYQLNVEELFSALDKLYKNQHETPEQLEFKTYFGQAAEPSLKPLARVVFERFPSPIISLTLKYLDGHWMIADLSIVDHKSLTDAEETAFSEALDNFSREVWHPKKARKQAKYDLAILVNENEQLPPSNPAAIKKFIQAGKNLGIDVEVISPNDFMRLPEFDALFIRETTSIEHHTYRFAKKAESMGLVVIDDPTSILRCTNKIYLADLFVGTGVPAPKTLILGHNRPEQLKDAAQALGFPIVVKIPDGSFSRGVVKVNTMEEFEIKTQELFQESSLLLAQEFLYTDFDWRIGILNHKALYACRYYMVKDHWQIYRHQDATNDKIKVGGYDTLPTFEVPRAVLQAALKATKQIGDGFYGVDVKQWGDKAYVIEVNDNPSIETGVEDEYLGNELYSLIMQEFLRRMDE
ncbi:MAG: RimK family protein [Pseudomonadales bacterium]|jgi:glutathione synthase/RimK-type ligase-like ATP-grasp enzyme|nr:RimK family protein [Pseudomonadales bacterium]